eukprot:7154642-Prymnesium_polylepis.1
MTVDLICYAIVRVLISAVEFFYVTSRRTERTLKAAADYASWRAAAEAADKSEGRDAWRAEHPTKLYDWRHALAT